MKPQEPIPHNYSIRSMNLVFLWTSVALLMVTGLIVGYDYVRGWKWFQLEFLRMQRERIDADLALANTEENKQQLADLGGQIKQTTVDLPRQRHQHRPAQRARDSWEGDHYRADHDYRFGKATLNARRYTAETYTVHH